VEKVSIVCPELFRNTKYAVGFPLNPVALNIIVTVVTPELWISAKLVGERLDIVIESGVLVVFPQPPPKPRKKIIRANEPQRNMLFPFFIFPPFNIKQILKIGWLL
jgi:hypothetical protein